MYLSILTTEQKKLFLDLAYNLAISDGDFSEYERQILKSYSIEMEMKVKMEDFDTNIDSIINNLNSICKAREKKIIIFEIIGLAMIDHHFDNCEKEIVRKALSVFELEEDFVKYCERKLTEYFKLQDELNKYILS